MHCGISGDCDPNCEIVIDLWFILRNSSTHRLAICLFDFLAFRWVLTVYLLLLLFVYARAVTFLETKCVAMKHFPHVHVQRINLCVLGQVRRCWAVSVECVSGIRFVWISSVWFFSIFYFFISSEPIPTRNARSRPTSIPRETEKSWKKTNWYAHPFILRYLVFIQINYVCQSSFVAVNMCRCVRPPSHPLISDEWQWI